ncbi:hypothetical protein L914_02209 [Phytophthora nicotianae]|uniref:Uncharacterized protein n=1 Tax=Phytophthora nicotianae TaxID=4792 RepID=W2P0E5_PHYNI|nr:hypothetical protein L914_02209 [Phytophthora nicotianae]
MRGYAIAAEKSLGQIWNELTKKGWLFRKSLGLSDDRRYLPPGGSLKGTEGVDYLLGDESLMRYCRRQGWPEIGCGKANAEAKSSSKSHPSTTGSALTTTVTTTSASKTPDIKSSAAKKPSAKKMPVAKKPVSKKPVAKISAAKRCAAKRSASSSSSSAARRRKRAAVDKTTAQDTTPAAVPDAVVPDITDIDIPDVEDTGPDTTQEPVPEVTTTSAEVTSDDDRLFGPLESDDLNVGEESANGSVEDDTEVSADEVDEEPVTFELDAGDLDRLQEEEWNYFDERHSGQVQVDAAPLYDGPSSPTKAALAYAENPLAIFYFFLPKELWRRIAAETNKYRLDSVDEVTQGIRRHALEKRLTTPSTTVLSVEEYRVKLRRKNSM